MGGIERVSEALAKILFSNGYNVVFLSLERTSLMRYESCFTEYFVDEDRNKQYTQLMNIINKHHIDVIINQAGLFKIATRSQIPLNVKIISVNHDSQYAMYKHSDISWLRKWRWKRIVSKELKNKFMQSDKVILFSEKLIPEYKFFYKEAKDDKFVIIPNFNVYTNPNYLKPKKKIVLFVGRLSFQCKRLDYLLRIWQKVHKKYPDWFLKIVGDGDYSDEAKMLAKKLNLTRYSFEGQQNPISYYEEASIFCLTSAFESFGMVITEAMQHGVVPMAFNSYTTASEIITDGEDGFLIEPFDIEAYAYNLDMLMSDEDLRKQMAKNVLINVQKFSHETVSKKWVSLLENI